ncbi:MAG: ATP synthase epsilon chain [Phycisphaerae bacterium]
MITPEAQAFDGPADFVVLPAHDGEIGILPNRAPLVCKLGAGLLRVRSGSNEEHFFIDGGFAQVIDNRVVVLTQKAIKPGQIDRAKAAAQLEEARAMRPADETAVKRKTQAEASARAQLRVAAKA